MLRAGDLVDWFTPKLPPSVEQSLSTLAKAAIDAGDQVITAKTEEVKRGIAETIVIVGLVTLGGVAVVAAMTGRSSRSSTKKEKKKR